MTDTQGDQCSPDSWLLGENEDMTPLTGIWWFGGGAQQETSETPGTGP